MKPLVIDRHIAWSGRYLQSLVLTCRNSDGKVIEWEAFKRIGCTGIVAIVPFTSDGFVIMTKQFRPPVNKYVIEFPAGLNDQNESLEEVAKREMLEETGYEASSLKLICEGPLSSGASTEVLTVFFARDVVYTGEQRLDSVEEIEVLKLPYEGFHDALLPLIDRDTYMDIKIPGLFELAKKFV